MGHAVEEIRGAIERVDDPARLGRVALDDAALLHQEPPIGACALQLLEQRLLGALVGDRDEVRGPLRLTCSSCVSPKSRRICGAALRAARSMTVMRPECDAILLS
jgi:hypothetical protein